MSAHTPGPWKVGRWSGICRKSHPECVHGLHPGPRGDNPCVYDPVFFEGTGIAGPVANQMVVGMDCESLVISPEDAQLIAAAPDLAEVLREIAAGGWSDVIEPVALARAALAKAGL